MVLLLNSKETFQNYEEYFSYFSFELSDFQKFAIQAIVDGHHTLSCVPTGSGKTVPALFAIQYFVEKQQKKVIYTSPIKALSNQKFYEFSTKFPLIDFGILTGDIKFNPDASVLIMTAEILQHKLFNNELNVEEIGCIIHDEIHMINDSFRGHVWENIILKTPPEIQMVMLSATLSHPEQFASWIESLSCDKKVYLSVSEKRHVPLQHYGFLTANKDFFRQLTESEKMEYETSMNQLKLLKKDGIFQTPNYHKMNTVVKKMRYTSSRIHISEIINSLCKIMVEKEMFPAVCFVLSKKLMMDVAPKITTEILPFDSKIAYTIDKECESILRQKVNNVREYFMLEEYTYLITLLRKGIAIHHSGMIPILREMVELLFERGKIKLLFATETFSVGLNMPIKTSIFTDVFKFDGSQTRMFLPHEFNQASGRAGRRGIDTIGHVVHLLNLYRPFDLGEFQRMIEGKPQILQSKFKFAYSMLLSNKQNSLWNQSLLQKEYNDYQRELYHDMEQQQVALDKINIDGLKTSHEIRQDYQRLVNNRKMKRNRKQNLLNEFLEEHPSVEQDLKMVENYNEKKTSYLKLEEKSKRAETLLNEKSKIIREMLQKEGFMDESFEPTKKGFIASHIKEVPSLVIASLWDDLKTLSSEDLICLLSCTTNVRVMEDYKTHFPQEMKDEVSRMEQLYDKYYTFEVNNKFDSGEEYELHFDLMFYVRKWIHVQDGQSAVQLLNTIKAEKQILLGDFVKAIMKINNIVEQFMFICEETNDLEFLTVLKQVPEQTLKFIVTNQSLYI
jgi:superfamily II RNA helicase